MSTRKSYNRFFIIFQEEDRGYGLGPDKPPTGYAKIETRNDKAKVTVYAQNLKQFDTEDKFYKCYLLSHQEGKDAFVYLGTMDIDDLGRGEASWETGVDNAFDSNEAIDKFNGAAILVNKPKKNEMVAPLAGYMSKEKFNWRNIFKLNSNDDKKNDKKIEDNMPIEKEVLKAQEEKFEKYEKEIEEIINSKQSIENEIEDENIIDKQVDIDSNINSNDLKAYKNEAEDNINTTKIDMDSCNKELYKEDTYTDDFINERNINEDLKLYNDYNNQIPYYQEDLFRQYDPSMFYSNNQCMRCSKLNIKSILKDALESILDDYEEVKNIDELKGCKLYKICMKNYYQDAYKINAGMYYDLVYYPLLFGRDYYEYIKKHGHYLFGIKYDKDSKKLIRLIYMIPGKNTVEDQPLQGNTGFLKWVKYNNEAGYWVMMYDPETGMIDTKFD